MRTCIFLGPSLPQSIARNLLDATYRPPAQLGDVARAVSQGYAIIGLVDGVFESVPAVWHKEILWALQERVHVLGAASMGALRAAELHGFGMQGVGWVFEQLASGALEDDDEVAVVHRAADAEYAPLSEAMVNIRQTLQRAADEGLLRPEEQAQLLELTKQLFYPERSYQRLVLDARASGMASGRAAALGELVRARPVQQKQLDARLLLERVRDLQVQNEPAAAAQFAFAHTDAWEQLVRKLNNHAATADHG